MVQAIEEAPGAAALVAQLSHEQAKVASDLKALTAIRSKLKWYLGRFQDSQLSYSKLVGPVLKTQVDDWENIKTEKMLTDKYLAVKKDEEANLKKIAADLSRKETDSKNLTRKTKADRDLNNQNVLAKRLATIDKMEQINQLNSDDRMDCVWSYVLLGEKTFYGMRDKGADLLEILDYATRTKAMLKGTFDDLLGTKTY